MTTLLLNPPTWDLTVDANGNIALATDPYAAAQDVASACRLFLDELWYDRRQGVPYFEQVLGKIPNAQYLRQQLVAAAESVPGVVNARVYFTALRNRSLGGQVQFTLAATGETLFVEFAPPWYASAADRAAQRGYRPVPGQLFDDLGQPLFDDFGRPMVGL